jgi:hypothetical protein
LINHRQRRKEKSEPRPARSPTRKLVAESTARRLAAACGFAVTVSIAHFVAFEVGNVIDGVNRSFAAGGPWTVRAGLNVETIIYVAVEAFGTVKPGANADENATSKPLWSVVAVGSALVRGIVIIAVRADGGGADINFDLGLRFGGGQEEAES